MNGTFKKDFSKNKRHTEFPYNLVKKPEPIETDVRKEFVNKKIQISWILKMLEINMPLLRRSTFCWKIFMTIQIVIKNLFSKLENLIELFEPSWIAKKYNVTAHPSG